ncbi:MAG TPA: glycosyltransferase [Actinomycetota bacterium]|nr:glycosyltransferase [Actinomycetota bacterium]
MTRSVPVAGARAAGIGAPPAAGRPRRVLLVFGGLERAGAQLRMMEVCRELRRDHLVAFDLCSLDLAADDLWPEAPSLGGAPRRVSIRSPWFPLRFARLLRAERYDAVLTEPQLLSGLVVLLAALAGVPVRIAAIHNMLGAPGQSATNPLVRAVLANRAFVWAMRALIRTCATDVVAVSRSALDSVLPGRWQAGHRCRVVYNGTDVAPFQEPPDRAGVRAEFGWAPDRRILIHVGRMSPQKNHRGILEVMRLVLDREPAARLLLVGDGKLRGEVERWIDRLGLRDVCAVTSGRRDVPRLLLASDVFLFPSLWEGLPGAPLEALAAGLPVVASDIPPIREIQPYFPGSILVSPPGDAEAHARNVLEALRRAPDREAVRARFERSPFALARSVEAYRDLFRLRAGRPEEGDAR